MIGTQSSRNNDVYLYFEGDELGLVEGGPVIGTYISQREGASNGTLSVTIDDDACRMAVEKAVIDVHRAEGGAVINLGVTMNSEDYRHCVGNGYSESMFICGKVFYRDANRLPFSDIQIYLELAKQR